MENAQTNETLTVTVSKREQVADGVISLTLLPQQAGSSLPEFAAGAHVDVHIGDFIRQYSLCSSPSDLSHYRLGVKLESEGRGGSQAVHAQIHEGQTLQISNPRNLFQLHDAADQTVLFAGGIGITPIMSMAQALHAAGKPFVLYYCCRSVAHAAFQQELLDSPFADRVHYYFDDDDSPSLDLGQVLASPHEAKHLYICGPQGFMDYVITHATDKANWATENVHFESFSAADLSQDSDAAFDVVIASTGQQVTVKPDQTVIEALQEQGLDLIPISCEQGVCGTCLTAVTEGTPDHRDMYLTDEEKAANDQFTPCCSRSLTGRLVLDL